MSNESVYERCGMRGCGSEVGCSVVKWVKRSTLRWFGHSERMENEKLVKKLYLSSAEGPNMGEKPLGRWEDRLKEYVCERKRVGVGVEGIYGQGA